MSLATIERTETSVKTFGADDFKRNAALYANRQRLVEAIVGVSADDRETAIEEALDCIAALEEQATVGALYTPHAEMGFGSNNASVIAQMLLRTNKTVGAIKKAFASLGKPR